jgi:hypothetical protein
MVVTNEPTQTDSTSSRIDEFIQQFAQTSNLLQRDDDGWLYTRPFVWDNGDDSEQYISVGTGMHQRFVRVGDPPEEPLIRYNYKLCGDFSDIREFLDKADSNGDCYLTMKRINTVENRDNDYTTEYEFSCFKDREYIQALIEQCDYPEDMALISLEKN